VDDYIQAQMQKQHIAGLSLAVVKDGKILKAKGYGLANVETNTPATPETVYKIASISKQFLAAGIMMLAQDGKLGLDDKISKYLEGTPEAWKDITIRHLLAHTSGLVEDPPGFDPFKPQPDTDVVKSAYSTKLLFAPGEKWSYSNLGYFALGEIIHKVSGKPWSEFVTERVFAPAKMAATRATTTTDIRTYRYRIIYQNDSLLASFRFNKDNKITGFGIEAE
jgi:D-alanyl-D-alanine carboxypeptidase